MSTTPPDGAQPSRHRFVANYKTAATFDGYADADALRRERGMFAASEPFVRAHGGPLTTRVLDAVPAEYRDEAAAAGLELNIDVRVHDLAAGDFPASPGWHCDSPFREVAFDARAATRAVQRNLVATISTHPDGVSNTEFLDTTVAFTSPAAAGSFDLWRDLSPAVDRLAERGTTLTTDGALTEFDCHTLHRATAARVPGVRLFVRISLWVPPHGHAPGLTHIEQTYRQVSPPRRTRSAC